MYGLDALRLSEKYNVSEVTSECDVCNKNGSITRGFERSNLVLRKLKACQGKIRSIEPDLSEIKNNITMIDERIKYNEMTNDESNRVLDNLKAIEKYLTKYSL